MTFPATSQVLDTLDGRVGAGGPLGAPNWGQAAFGDGSAPVIQVGGGVVAAVNGVASSSLWTVPVARLFGAYVQFRDVPTGVIQVGAVLGLGAVPSSWVLAGYDAAGPDWDLQVSSGDNGGPGPTIAAGDWLACGFDPNLSRYGTAYVYHRLASGNGGWNAIYTAPADSDVLSGGANHRLFIRTNDGSCRLWNFGGDVLPGVDPTLNKPIVIHGHGAC